MNAVHQEIIDKVRALLEEHFSGYVLGVQVHSKDTSPLVTYGDTSFFAAAGLAAAVGAAFDPSCGGAPVMHPELPEDEEDDDDDDDDDDLTPGPEDPRVRAK